MCGIAGHLALEGAADSERVLAMLHSQTHRGPDGGGLWTDGRCALGHRRLAIHDLSSRGLQPLRDHEDDLVVAVNGTIHNAPEIRKDEGERGYKFRSRSDSEVLIPLYRRLGPELVHRLRGPFAFAIYSRRTNSLLLARDRLGQKPLYLARESSGLIFSSEFAAIAGALETRTYRRDRAARFLQHGFVPENRTALDEVEQLPPGTRLHMDGSGIRVERYWSPTLEEDRSLDEQTATGLLEQKLQEAITLRTRSERPMGLLLSGGLDSAALMVMSGRVRETPMATFTMGFEEAHLDERASAERVAQSSGATHRAWVFDVDPGPVVDRLVRTTGELLGDSSWIPTSLLLERASEEATVFLSGEGGDELLLGYDRYQLCRAAMHIRPRWLRRGLSQLHRLMPTRRARRAMLSLEGPDLSSILSDLSGLLPRRELAPLLDPELQLPLLRDSPGLPRHGGAAAGILDLERYLPGDLLAKGDRAGMSHGVETWSPFLDHELVEAVLRIPGRVRMGWFEGKRPLRRLLAPHLPASHLRQRKRGFGAPLARWLVEGSYGAFAESVLGDVTAPFEGLLMTGSALPLLRRLRAGETHLAPVVHAAVVLALWHDAFAS